MAELNFIGEEEIAEIRYTPSLIILRRIFTGFKLILSKEKITIETKIKTKRENFSRYQIHLIRK